MQWIARDHWRTLSAVEREPIPLLKFTLYLIYYLITDLMVAVGAVMMWAAEESGLLGLFVSWGIFALIFTQAFVTYSDTLVPIFGEKPLAITAIALPLVFTYLFNKRSNIPFVYEIEEEQEQQQQKMIEQQSNPAADDEADDRRDDRGDDAGEDDETDSYEPQYVKEQPDIDLRDVAGNQELIRELHNKIIDPLANPRKYEEYGLDVETGFLLYGPPGTGKTYTAKALAGTMDINWMPVMGSEITSKFIGAGTENIAEMFQEAIDHQPVILFLDEIDALAPERGGAGQHEDQTKQVNTMLEWVSKIHDEDHRVVIIGATNRKDRIDDAMLRSGRLTTQIEVPYPDEEARIGIIDEHLDAPRGEIDWDTVGDATEGMSGADMEAVADESARLAMERGDDVLTGDLVAAADKIRE